ncbi:MAG TPA: hypothetical protein DCZ10_11240 [Pelotomaculum sp.]|nr:hypothetical protein [Pelotomaculum sp.]
MKGVWLFPKTKDRKIYPSCCHFQQQHFEARNLKLENGTVTFKWRDYRNGDKQKHMSLATNEFIRRFLIHVLPDGFTKIRHYGLLSSINKPTRLRLCKKLTNTLVNEFPKDRLSTIELLNLLTGRNVTLCPCCGSDISSG